MGDTCGRAPQVSTPSNCPEATGLAAICPTSILRGFSRAAQPADMLWRPQSQQGFCALWLGCNVCLEGREEASRVSGGPLWLPCEYAGQSAHHSGRDCAQHDGAKAPIQPPDAILAQNAASRLSDALHAPKVAVATCSGGNSDLAS